MCRVCLFNRQALEWLLVNADADYLTPWLEQLITSNGGDGNGASVMLKYGKKETIKGLTLQPEQATEWFLDAYLAGARYFLFHTRRASIGAISTENCHPFRVGSTVLIHNGHDERMITDAEKRGYKDNGMPDSRAGAFLVDEYGPDVLKPYSGTFLGFHKREPFVTLGQGNWPLHRFTFKGDGKMYASEKPRHIKASCYNSEDMRPYKPPTYTSYGSNTWGYGGTYNQRFTWNEATHEWEEIQPGRTTPKITRNLTLKELDMTSADMAAYYEEQQEKYRQEYDRVHGRNQ